MHRDETTSTRADPSGPVAVPLVTGVVLGILAGGLEYGLCVGPGVRRAVPWETLLGFHGATGFSVLLFYQAAWFMLALHLGRHYRLNLRALALSAGLYLFLVFLFLCGSSFHSLIVRGRTMSDWLAVPVAVLVSIPISVYAYRVLAGSNRLARLKSVRRRFISSLILFGIMLIVMRYRGLFGSERAGVASVVAGNHRVPHVILIVVDTLRRNALSCYPGSAVATPSIEEFAQDCLVFTKAYSPSPWTLPSMASIMTGYSPSVHYATHIDSKIPNGLPTLAEAFSEEGYRTAAFVVQRFLGPERGFARGFDEYVYYPDRIASMGSRLLGSSWSDRPVTYLPNAPELTQGAVQWFHANKERKFFVWLHYCDPHIPYAPPLRLLPGDIEMTSFGEDSRYVHEIRRGLVALPDREKDEIRSLYYGEVRLMDEGIGQLLEALKDLGLYEESLILLTSDHGEELWDHGGYEHGHTLYDELIRIPLLVKVPFSVRRGELGELVTTQGIMATILDSCGIPEGPNDPFAPSFGAFLGGGSEAYAPAPIVSSAMMYFDQKISVVFEDMKYIESLETGKTRLYDLDADPHELESVLELRPEALATAEEILRRHETTSSEIRDRVGVSAPENLPLDEESVDALEALGYIQ